jgi:heat shock protein HslJ
MYRLGVGVLLVCFLAACGGPDVVGSPTAKLDGEWELTSGRGPEGEISIPPKAQVTLEVARGSMRGTAACNMYEGRLVTKGADIRASRIGQTEMGCDLARSRAENHYLAALQAIATYRRSSNQLTLLGEDTELNFDKVPTPPPSSFTGTDWELTGLLHGAGPGGMMSEPRPARMTFADDGSFEGTTGCSTISGAWKRNGDRIETSDITIGAQSCPELKAEQHEHVVSVLEAGFTFDIQENTMDLDWVEGERGLYYVDR